MEMQFKESNYRIWLEDEIGGPACGLPQRKN